MSSKPQDRTLAQQLSRTFITFGGLVGAAFVVVALMYVITRVLLTPDRERTEIALRAEGVAHTAMVEEESGVSGYLLTREARYLDTYRAAELTLARANRQLTSYVGNVSGVPEMATMVVSTRMAQEAWQRWAKVAAAAGPDVSPPNVSEGKGLFDAYRGEERSLAAALKAQLDLRSQRERRVIGARMTIELSVLIVVLLLAVNQYRTLQSGIVAPVAALLRHIRGIRDGQMEKAPALIAPRELAQLGEGLNEMVQSLATLHDLATSRDQDLRTHSFRLRQILEASREFAESLNLTYVVTAVRTSTAAVGNYDRVLVWLMDTAQKRLVNSDPAQGPGSAAALAELGHGLAGRAAKSGRITFEDTLGQVRFAGDSGDAVCAIAIPLIVGARAVGVLEARTSEARIASREAIEILEMLATHAATAIESARLHEVIEERSQLDPLTHLFNRRRLEEDLDSECKRCARYHRPLAFVMLDIDHFKDFNDSHGHPQADVALQDVAEILAGCMRTTDTAYRYGGEEFCVLLRETSASDGMLFAERLRHRIELRFAAGGMAGITASFGVAEFAPDAPTARALVQAADSAMYDSKHAGRNRVSLSARPPPLAS